ncbi:TSL-kinase interacting protein 1 isoform X2 [Euphorbia lathyris]|uniref:TSL-kinase interacting protein 1 isoform X2 n=1 Tax=Euphorbia lathyris TaxID=212925 RepID=UPI003314224C
MEMDSHFYLNSKVHFPAENNSTQHGDPVIAPPIPDHVEPQLPAKKPTRQWAAWTRQEEESFFTALRQVGKNFEKITRRVQSKNKDQVRHYYYRLVRRMNKLLGPGLCLDAKNSKDTNAAMLRWWSLLEKYSCKASKLHLKPRRFKIFIEALENQLMKDRKKTVRKRPSQVDNGSLTAPSAVTSQNRISGNETRTVKLVLVDSQNLQRLGAGKGSIKRNVNIGVIRSNRGDSTVMKPPRQRRKQGVASAAAYKKWEKAAIAGVSLVADAAEHLERTATDKEVVHDHGIAETKSHDPIEKDLPSLLVFSQNHYVESNAHANMKLKLQLFPIDEGTRRALEMDNHNPHLELTLSTRKKISSVMEHLNRKWGGSSIASGELMLFPYSAHRENLAGYQSWTQDSIVCAADVYSTIGSPSVFRLRYGWFSKDEFPPMAFQAPSASSLSPSRDTRGMENERRKLVDSVPVSGLSTSDQSEKHMDVCRVQLSAVDQSEVSACKPADRSNEMCEYVATGTGNNLVETSDPVASESWNEKGSDDRMDIKQLSDTDDLRLSNDTALSAGEWADSLTNINIGDLLSEVPNDAPTAQIDQCLQQMPFSCDSFDAAIAAHMSKHQHMMVFQSTVTSNTSSIWDAEETCDAFSFQKNYAERQQIPTSTAVDTLVTCKEQIPTSTAVDSLITCKEANSTISGSFAEIMQKLHSRQEPVDYPADENHFDTPPPDFQAVENSPKDFTGLSDIYWPESLGPFDLEMASTTTKYHTEDFMLTDSLSGLNRLIASSLDAFQNCSFFGLDKKESSTQQPAADARESSLFSDFKIGSQV